jgi:hypothetical protein
MRPRRLAPAALTALAPAAALVLGASPALAAEPAKVACARAAEDGQRLRAAGQLREALSRFTVCAQERCPGLIRTDCSAWRVEVDAALPSIVVRATAGEAPGRELLDVEIEVDGEVATRRLDGRALPLDPGEHRFVFRAPGRARVERSVLIRVGEKHRLLEVALPPEGSPLATPPARVDVASAAPAAAAPRPPRPRAGPGVWALAGVGAVGLAGFAYFGLTGYADVRSMRTGCKPGCPPADVDAARTKLLVADLSLAAGLVALGGAAWLAWRAPAAGATIEVAPVPGGTIVGLRRELPGPW